MQINNISNNNFEGKFILSKTLSKKEKDFAETLLNYRFDGKTNAEYLKNKNFDVNILGQRNKKSIHQKMFFQIGIKHIGIKANERGKDIKTIKADSIRRNEGIYQATWTLRNLIDRTDAYIDENIKTQYNTDFQKFIVKAKMFLGIV